MSKEGYWIGRVVIEFPSYQHTISLRVPVSTIDLVIVEGHDEI